MEDFSDGVIFRKVFNLSEEKIYTEVFISTVRLTTCKILLLLQLAFFYTHA